MNIIDFIVFGLVIILSIIGIFCYVKDRNLWFIVLICLSPFNVFGQAGTTPGTVRLLSTFQCISVKANYTGDANSNNSCTFGYRLAGSGNFISAYTPFIDRRNGTAGGGSNTDAYTNQARGSIIGLTPNTSYDVKVTWSDPDGITGNASSTNTISTLSYTFPTGGSTINANSDATLVTALSTVTAGQTISIASGTYKPITVSVSGNSGAYILIQGASDYSTIIAGTNINQNIQENASYVVFDHLTLGPSDHYGFNFQNGNQGVWIQNCVMQDVSDTCSNGVASNYGDTGIWIGDGASNIFILSNQVHSAAGMLGCSNAPSFNCPGTGIGWHANVFTLVIQSNIVDGGFRDGISLDNGLLTENVDINANNVIHHKDDGIESKAGGVNLRIWGNRVTNFWGFTVFALNAGASDPYYGPTYVFRNYGLLPITNASAGNLFKLGNYCPPIFFFHNTVDGSSATSCSDGWAGGNTPFTCYNNIIKNCTDIIANTTNTSVFDYNLWDETTTADTVYHWNSNPAISYHAMSDFRTATGNETHGLQTDPLLNADLSVPNNSPAVNAGVSLNNFNGPNSLWPFTSANPTIGAFEANAPTGSGGGITTAIGVQVYLGNGVIIK